MPYITRDMADFLHKQKLSDIDNDTNITGGTNNVSDSEGRKLREQPISVVPISSCADIVSELSSKLSSDYNKSKSKMTSSKLKSISLGSKQQQQSISSCRKVSKKPLTSSTLLETKYVNQHKNLSFNEKMLKYTVGLLKSNIKKLMAINGSINIEHCKEFKAYKIDYNTTLITKLKNCDKIVKAVHKNKEFKEFPLCCKIYNINERQIDPNNSEYLKILRSLSLKHPSIAQTWGIFYDSQQQNVLIIQEYFVHGSTETYLIEKNYPCFNEKKVSEISQQIAMALDFLGDMGISHRSLSPKYIMIVHRDPIRVKLTGFRSSIIYWNIEKENVNLIPCISIKDKPIEPDFQAPEVYGDTNTEAFDPIRADIWSFGASIYFLLTKNYPYDFSRDNPKIEEEIQANVNLTNTSSKCQNFLSRILCTSAEHRMKFDRIANHPWIMQL